MKRKTNLSFLFIVLLAVGLLSTACRPEIVPPPETAPNRILPSLPPTETVQSAGTLKATDTTAPQPDVTVPPEPNASPIAEDFCSSGAVQKLLDDFDTAVKKQDGIALVKLTHPVKGLIIRHESWNPEVQFKPGEVVLLFTSKQVYDWGVGSGSGQPIKGTFNDVIQPQLLDVLTGSYTRHCNTLENGVATGGTTAVVEWPKEYAGLSFFALYRAAPAGQEQDWRTWAVGIEFFDGKPYISVLVQYHWEI